MTPAPGPIGKNKEANLSVLIKEKSRLEGGKDE